MKNALIFFQSIFVFSVFAQQVVVDPHRIQQVLANEKGTQLLLQLRRQAQAGGYQYQLSLVDTRTGVQNTLPISASSLITATWGPTPQQISYVQKKGLTNQILTYDIASKKKRTLATMNVPLSHLLYSPHYKKLALLGHEKPPLSPYYFEGDVRPRQKLWIYDLAKKKLLPVGQQLGSIDAPVQWFSDEKRLLLSYRPSLEYFDSWHANIAIVDDKGSVETLTNNQSLNHNALLSPDQNLIAYTTNDAPTALPRPEVFQFAQIRIYDISKKMSVLLPETFDASPRLLGFSSQGNALLFNEAQGVSVVFKTMASKAPYPVMTLTKDLGITRTWSLNHHRDFLTYIEEGPTRAARACIQSLGDFNEHCFKVAGTSLDLSDVSYETVSYPSVDGQIIEALVAKPKGIKGPLPTIIVAHGGPTYHSFAEYLANPYSLGTPLATSWLVKKGFVVFMPNIRGSMGYGPVFRMANHGDLGGKDLDDLFAGLNYLVKQKIADEKKLGIFGWSYGGFLCERAATQSSRFKAAVCGAAISNWISHDGTSEFKAYVAGYFGKNYSPNTASKLMTERSPALTIKNSSTPMLLLHGTDDKAVNFGQALEMFWALKRHGAPVKLAAFPEEGHVFTKVASKNASLQLVSQWFLDYLSPQSGEAKTINDF